MSSWHGRLLSITWSVLSLSSHLFNPSFILFFVNFLHLTMPSFSLLAHFLSSSSCLLRTLIKPVINSQPSLSPSAILNHSFAAFSFACPRRPHIHPCVLPCLPSSYICITTSLVYHHTTRFPHCPHLSRPPSSCISPFIFLSCSHLIWSYIASSPHSYPAVLVKYFHSHPLYYFTLPPFFPLTTNTPLYSSLSRSRTPCSSTRQRSSLVQRRPTRPPSLTPLRLPPPPPTTPRLCSPSPAQWTQGPGCGWSPNRKVVAVL